MSDIPFARSFPLLTLLLCGGAILFFLLAGLSLLQSWLTNKRRDLEAIEWGPPRPSLAEVGPIRSPRGPAVYLTTSSATGSVPPAEKTISRLHKAEASRAESFWQKGCRSWHMPPFLALGGGEILKQFAGLLELARIGLIADFEDGIGHQLSTFRYGLSGCMEEIQQCVTQRPDLR